MKPWQADIFILISSIFWGFAYIFNRWALLYCSPALFVFFRFALAALAAGLILHKSIRLTSPLRRRQGLILGLLMGCGYILQIFSVNFTQVARSAFISSMFLLAVPIMGFLIFRDIIKIPNLIGVVLAAIGLYIFLDPNFSGVNAGDVMAFASIPMWALYMIYLSVYTKQDHEKDSSLQFLFWQLIGLLPVSLLTYLVFESGLFLSPLHPDLGKGLTITPMFLTGLSFTAFLCSILAVFLQTRFQKYTTAVQAANCYQIQPIIATLAAFFILGEPLKNRTIIGGAIIIAALLCSEVGGVLMDKKKAPQS
ncbi:MAG: DMT family transporter [Deltaproteobacteria bacterium]|jgi:drug/metabolite transporter (DMT)-like permease|nr:DMT family transporter [Deltaproteobacteria bacterium]